MAGWLTIVKSIGTYVAGWGVSVFFAWLGFSRMYRWYTTGGVLTHFRDWDNLTKWQIITYESDSFGFVSLCALRDDGSIGIGALCRAVFDNPEVVAQ